MRILVAHNRYQHAGGEDVVYEHEARLLEEQGHDVFRYEVSNDGVDDYSAVALAKATVWNAATYREIGALIRRHRPDVAHFHNTFPLISPSAYDACLAHEVPVVQTLHNYRLLCPAADLYRAGAPCELCVKRTLKWPAVRHACYRGDRKATSVTVAMLALHHARGTYRDKVGRYIALTEFAKGLLVAGGIPADRIVVKGNSVPDATVGQGEGGYALFVGRLSPEKGLSTLLAAWAQLGGAVPLKIVGDGPESEQVAQAARRVAGVEQLDRQPRERVMELMRRAAFLVFPTRVYEGMPMTILEAYSVGTPVVASRLGAAPELVEEGRTGHLFAAGDSEELAEVVRRMAGSDLSGMRREARAAYEARFTPARNLGQLLEVYRGLLQAAG